jgi:hypothetical protein
MEGSTKDGLVVRGRPIDRDKGRFSSRNFKSKGRSKSSSSVDEDDRNEVKLGIIKRTVSRRKQKSVLDPTRSS